MLTEQQLTVLNPGETAVLECSFTSARYNMFDYPVIWRKQQLDEWTQINVMESVNEPFASGSSGTSRFEVSFTAAAPIYHVELTIMGTCMLVFRLRSYRSSPCDVESFH